MRFYLLAAGLVLVLLTPFIHAAEAEDNGAEKSEQTTEQSGEKTEESKPKDSTQGSTAAEPDCD